MIPVTLSKKGHARWITQHFGINGWGMQPMVVPRCARCFGILIFWKTVLGDKIVYSITGIHLPPGTPKYTKYIKKELFRRLPKEVPGGEPYYIIACGGKVNNPQNRFYYKKSVRNYLLPFERKFPNVQIDKFAVKEDTVQTTMFLHKNGTVSARLYHSVTHN